ncbi:MAG: DUF6580 family putative transport protein [Bacteroidota bacterium]|jgi:hypothetical protein
MNKIITPRLLFVVAMVFVAAFSRLIAHIPNMTPVFAIALFGGTFIKRKALAFLIPLAAMIISDVFLGFYTQMYAIYISFAITVAIGFYLRRKVNAATVVGASLISSIVFFVLSNFAVWISGVGILTYPMTVHGFMFCYMQAIPFFGYELVGTLLYTTVFFGIFTYVVNKFPVLAKV